MPRMHLNIVDTAYGRDHSADRMTVTAHTLIARDHAPARPTVLQAVIVNTPLLKDARATVSVLSDGFAWTTLLDLPPSEWLRQVNPTTRPETVRRHMDELAENLFARAVTILEG